MTETLPYGAWRSPITSDLIVAGSIGLGGVLVDGADIYWSEGRPAEGGRSVIVRRGADGANHDVNPPPWNARTRVHEYGGGSAVIDRGTVYFSHFADQRLYRLAAGGTPEPLTPETEPGTNLRYADGVIDRARNRWIGVREQHLADGTVTNTVVAVDLSAPTPAASSRKGTISTPPRACRPTARASPSCNGTTPTCRGSAPSCWSPRSPRTAASRPRA